MTTIIDGVTVSLEVLEGRGLVAKDRAVFGLGKKTTSDPYAVVLLGRREIGKTKVVPKTLAPVWNTKIQEEIPFRHAASFAKDPGSIVIHLFDEDVGNMDDFMGAVIIPLKDIRNVERQWYPVTKTSGSHHCRNATGEVCISLSIGARRLLRLEPGNTHPLRYSQINIGLAWEPERGAVIDMDASCVAVSACGEVLIEDTVYYGNLFNPSRSIVHSGDETTGHLEGDDETITLHLSRIPASVQCLYLVLSVVTPNQTLAKIRSAQVRFYHSPLSPAICGLIPADFGDATSMIVARIARDAKDTSMWVLNPILVGRSPDRDFGTLIPEIKSYSRDLIPSIRVDPTERIAIMRKGGEAIRVRDFCPNEVIPNSISLGLAWDITNGTSIDLDASAICLDSNLQQVDLIYFRHLRSNDGAIVHSGDERFGEKAGDDETITITLDNVDPRTAFIGIVINSFSGQELDDVAAASCHLYDSASRRDIARYAMTNSQALDKHTALVMGCLYRYGEGGEWVFRIISEAAQGRTVHDNVDELQNFLRRNPAAAPVIPVAEEEIDLSMPAFVAHDEEEIVVVPLSDLKDDEIVVPPH